MELFLWRHADALPENLNEPEGRSFKSTPDFGRELSPLGHQQAGKVAEWFREHVRSTTLSNLRILVSPAVRTRQTIAHFCENESDIQLCLPLYENASPNEILDILGWPGITLPTLIVGHQPQLGIFADYLLANTPHPESFHKGALWWLRIEPGQNKARLLGVVEP